jgi:branched-chain amino acid transport system ATP-binding protein
MTALLNVRDLSKRFGGLQAVKDVSFSLAPGTITGVLGPNGADKTTLLKAISRTVVPPAGTVRLNGRPLDGLPAHKVVACGICHCPEGRRLFPELSVLKNLMLGAYLRDDKHGIARDLQGVYALFRVLKERGRQQAC